MADDLRITQESIQALTTEDANRNLRVTQESARVLTVPDGNQVLRVTQESVRTLIKADGNQQARVTQESISVLFTPIRVYEMVVFNDIVQSHLAVANNQLSDGVAFSAFFNKKGEATDGVKFNDILVYKVGWELRLTDGVAFNDRCEANVVYLPVQDGVKFNDFIGYAVSKTAVSLTDGVAFDDLMYDPFFCALTDGVVFTAQANLFTDCIAEETVTFTDEASSQLDFWSYGSTKRLYSDDLMDYPDHYWQGDLVNLDWDSSSLSNDWRNSFLHANPEGTILLNYSYRRLEIADSGPGWIELMDELDHYIFPNTVFSIYKDSIAKGTFEWTRSAERDKPNRVQVKYLNRDDDYKVDIITMDNEASQDWNSGVIRTQSYEINGVKRTTQASRLAQILLDEATYADWTIKFTTDIAGYKFCMGEIIGITRSELDWFGKLFRIVSIEEMADYEVKITALEYKPELYTENPPLQRSSGSLAGHNLSPYMPPQDLEAIFAFEEYLKPRVYVMAKPYASEAWNFAGFVMNYAVTAGLNIRPASSDWRSVDQVLQCPPSVNLVMDHTTYLEYDPATMYGSFPAQGVIMVGEEMIFYSWLDDATNCFRNLKRGYNDTKIVIHQNLKGDRAFLFTDNIWYYEYPEEEVSYILWIVARAISPGGVVNQANDPQEYWIMIGGQALKPLRVGSLRITMTRGVEIEVPGILNEAMHYEEVRFNDYCTNTIKYYTQTYLDVRESTDTVAFLSYCRAELDGLREVVAFGDSCSVYVAETLQDGVSFFSYCANSYGTRHEQTESIIFDDTCTATIGS